MWVVAYDLFRAVLPHLVERLFRVAPENPCEDASLSGTCGTRGQEVGKQRNTSELQVGRVQDPEEPLESLVGGDCIKKELWDTRSYHMDPTLKTDCTKNAKNEIKHHAIFVVSVAGHNPHELVCTLSYEFPGGGAEKPNGVTKGVKEFATTAEGGWAVEGIVEEVTFFLAPGWNLGDPTEGVEKLLKGMKRMAKKRGIPVKTLEEQLVVLLVHKAEDVVAFLDFPSYQDFLSALFVDQKHLLVPVLINAERCTDEDLDLAKGRLHTKLVSLSKEHGGEGVTVHEAMPWSNTPEATKKIHKDLAQACRGRLESKDERRKIMESLLSVLQTKLKHCPKERDSQNALARRWVWLWARLLGSRIKGLQLDEKEPWADAERVVRELKDLCLEPGDDAAEDGWHMDDLRCWYKRQPMPYWPYLTLSPPIPPSPRMSPENRRVSSDPDDLD